MTSPLNAYVREAYGGTDVFEVVFEVVFDVGVRLEDSNPSLIFVHIVLVNVDITT